MKVEPYLITAVLSLLSLLLTIVGYLITRTLKQIDSNQARLYGITDDLEKRVSYLQGQHDQCAACKK